MDENKKAEGSLYYDDGISTKNIENNLYVYSAFTYEDGIFKNAPHGETTISKKMISMKIYNADSKKDVKIDGNVTTDDGGVITVTGLDIDVGKNYISSAQAIAGLIVGIVLGLIAIAAIITFCVYWFVIRKSDDDETDTNKDISAV